MIADYCSWYRKIKEVGSRLRILKYTPPEIIPMPKSAKMGEGKCSCSPVWMIISAIVMAVGIFLLVQGFVTQLQLQGSWDSSDLTWAVGYYFVGVLLIGAGKILKWKACSCCSAHCGISK